MRLTSTGQRRLRSRLSVSPHRRIVGPVLRPAPVPAHADERLRSSVALMRALQVFRGHITVCFISRVERLGRRCNCEAQNYRGKNAYVLHRIKPRRSQKMRAPIPRILCCRHPSAAIGGHACPLPRQSPAGNCPFPRTLTRFRVPQRRRRSCLKLPSALF